jgi:hypothetical protein
MSIKSSPRVGRAALPVKGEADECPHGPDELAFRCRCSLCTTYWAEYEAWRVLNGLTPTLEQWSKLQTAYTEALKIGEMWGKTGTGLM